MPKHDADIRELRAKITIVGAELISDHTAQKMEPRPEMWFAGVYCITHGLLVFVVIIIIIRVMANKELSGRTEFTVLRKADISESTASLITTPILEVLTGIVGAIWIKKFTSFTTWTPLRSS